MSASSRDLISFLCRTCLQQLPCESSYNLFATPGLAKKLTLCTSLSVEQQDGFPDNICEVCYTRLHEMHDFQEQCIDAVQKFQNMVRLIGLNEMKTPSGFENSHNEQQDKNRIKNENVISNDFEDITIDSENSLKKIIECEQVVLGAIEKIEIEETQIIQENFSNKRVDLQNNETSLTGGKKDECDAGEENCTSFSDLKDQKNIHTGEKPYVCKTCEKEFSHRIFLMQHEVTHNGEKPHKCEICNKKFTWAANLKHHKTIHTGEKHYVCKTCGKQFSHPSHVKRHEVIHGEKRHKCETCGKCFLRAWDLTVHGKTHTGEKPHKCKTCEKGFKSKQFLQIHQKKCMHGSYNEFEVSDKSKLKDEMDHDSPASSDMGEIEFIIISSK